MVGVIYAERHVLYLDQKALGLQGCTTDGLVGPNAVQYHPSWCRGCRIVRQSPDDSSAPHSLSRYHGRQGYLSVVAIVK